MIEFKFKFSTVYR